MAYIGNEPGVSSQRVETTFTATAGQTTFTPASGYTVGSIDVYVNGVKLMPADFTASNGTTVVLTSACAVGDEVAVVAYLPRGLSDGYLKTESDSRFVRNDVSAGLVASGGNIGIGGSNPNGAKLQVKVSATNTLEVMGPNTGTGVRLFAREEAGALNRLELQGRSIVMPLTSGTDGLTFDAATGVLSLPQGQIKFPSTQIASTDANTLDDYEEGTWTPRMGGYSNGALKTVGAGNYGWYRKVGSLVTVGGTLSWNGAEALTGNIILSGLPFVADNPGNAGTNRGGGSAGANSGGIVCGAGFYGLTVVVDANSAFAWIIQTAGNTFSHTPTVNNSGYLYGFTFSYTTT